MQAGIEYRGLFFLEASTTTPAVLATILEAFASTEGMAPDLWGPIRKQRRPWSPDEIREHVAAAKVRYPNFYDTDFMLWRSTQVAYEAGVSATDGSVAQVRFTFRKPTKAGLRQIYERTSDLVGKLPLIYGAVHPVAREGDAVRGLSFREAILCLEGVYLGRTELRERGLPRPSARTWYGRIASERIGERTLRELGATPCGASFALDLLPEPWAASIPQLFERQSALYPALAATGMFSLVELNERGHDVRAESGPRWTRASWVLDLGDLRRARIPHAWLATRGDEDAWASEGDIDGLDLQRVDLAELAVDGVTATDADLRRASLRGFRARDADFSRANFDGADLSQAYFFDCQLAGARFEGARMNDANLATSALDGAHLDAADLGGATLAGASLRDASLRKIRLVGADLRKANLRRADLTGADLTRANLKGTDLREATLADVVWTDAILDGTRFDPGTGPSPTA